MTAIDQVLDNVEAYYGAKYNAIQRQVVAEYLWGFQPEALDELFARVVKMNLYGQRPPLVEHYERAAQERREARKDAIARIPTALRIEEGPIATQAEKRRMLEEFKKAHDADGKAALYAVLEEIVGK